MITTTDINNIINSIDYIVKNKLCENFIGGDSSNKDKLIVFEDSSFSSLDLFYRENKIIRADIDYRMGNGNLINCWSVYDQKWDIEKIKEAFEEIPISPYDFLMILNKYIISKI